jgi:excisionase family DNA binding protein
MKTRTFKETPNEVWDQEMVLVPRTAVKPLLVTIKQAQYMLGNVSDKTVRRMIRDGRLPRAMFSRKILIPYAEVERIAQETNLAVLDA